MSSGTQNIPLIRLEQRVEDLKKGFKLNTISNLVTLGAIIPIINITSSGLIGVNVASPNTQSIITIKNNDQIGWQNASAFLTRTPSSTSVTTRDAGSRIFKSSDNNFYIDNMDGNTVFRRGGIVSGSNFLFSNTIFISGTTGNVGFSNSAPEARIHVGAGDILLENGREIYFKNASGTNRGVLTVGSSGLASLTAPGSLSLNVNSDSTEIEAISIASDGRVNVISNLYTSGMYRIISAPTISSTAGATTLTAAQILGRVFVSTAATAVTLTFPTGNTIEVGLPENSPIGTSFEFTIVNAGSSTGAITLVSNTGLTFYIAVTTSTIAINTARTYLFRKTGTNTFDVFTLSMS
jgi:hypothetical protein